MSQTGVIIRRNANKTIPSAYLDLALKENPTAWGVSFAGEEGLMVNCGEKPDAELINETCKEFPDKDLIFYLCNSDGGINMEDVSPFSIIEEQDQPRLIAFVDGNFPGHVKKESSHPGEFFFFNEYLRPKFLAMAEMCDNDVNKLMAQIAKPVFKKEMLLGAVSRGYVTLVAGNGKILSFAQGDTASEYPWGWVSHNYGYAMGPPKKEEPKAEKRSMFPSKSTVREPAPAAAKKPVDTPPATAGAASMVKNYGTRKERPPEQYSKKDRKAWYQKRIGYCPPNWLSRPEVEVWVDPTTNRTMMYKDIQALGIGAVGVPKLNNPERGKDTAPDHIETPADKQVTGEILPILSPTARDYVNKLRASDKVKKIVDENGNVLEDPRVVKQLEEKFATFAAQLGASSIDEFLCWTHEMYFNTCKDRPDVGACMLFNFRNIIAANKAKEKSKTVTEPEKQELAAEELKPKRSMFPQKKTA